jgi:hypothetical protein
VNFSHILKFEILGYDIVGVCGFVLSYQTLNVTASRDSGASKAYLVLKTPGDTAESPSSSWAGERGGTG